MLLNLDNTILINIPIVVTFGMSTFKSKVMFNLDNILRENVKNIKPYSSARDEYSGTEGVFLDANENPIGSVSEGHYNRYPDPYQSKLKSKISDLKRVNTEQIFLGNGSDEAIDLLFRAVCTPAKDNVIILPPTYGMYEVSANINDVEIKKVSLTPNFEINLDAVIEAIDENTKMITESILYSNI